MDTFFMHIHTPIRYRGVQALTWIQLSRKAAMLLSSQYLATSAGVVPFFIHPHDDPERDEP